jgi:hypothetical protein
MKGDIEILVVNPHRPRDTERHFTDPLAIARDKGDASTDQSYEALMVKTFRWRPKNGHATYVHGSRGILEVQERCIYRRKSIHPGPLSCS